MRMNDTKEFLERAWRRAPQPARVMDSLIRRRARRQRTRRITAAVLAIIFALVSFAALIRTFSKVERPADEPTPRDIFARVHGWIAFGTLSGIWAVNPAGQGRPQDEIKLSDALGDPLAWSRDGSKLLISQPGGVLTGGVLVLNADGSEAAVLGVAEGYSLWNNASLSPNGSQVVYAGDPKDGLPSAIYVVDSGGGTPQLLHSSGRRWYPSNQDFFRTALFNPTFSPDGTKIAYFDGMGDWGNSLRVMNADGTGVRVLSKVEVYPNHLGWSPDGSRLVFHAFTYHDERPHGGWGIWVIDADGSGLTKVIRARDPNLSPNGSRIGYAHDDRLESARWDGTHVRELVAGDWTNRGTPRISWAWNPLPLSASGEEDEIAPASGASTPRDPEPTATAGGSSAAPFVYAIVLLGVVVILVAGMRTQRRRLDDGTSSEWHADSRPRSAD